VLTAPVPNAIAILGKTYGSSRTRAIVFSILGALAPAGFVVGGLIGGFFTEEADTRWIWWFTQVAHCSDSTSTDSRAILSAAVGAVGVYIIPSSPRSFTDKSLDYPGAILLVLALGFFNFAWNQGPVVGWPVPYVYALLILSVVFAAAFYFWEKRMGDKALIPTEVLSRNSLLVYLCLFLGWMSFGLYALYLVLL